jgi:mRNA-degrading endonuclease RelE of RelBE toxin-antitoxin system
MIRRPKFAITYAPETFEHLDAIERKYHGLIQETIDQRLGFTPERESRNQKLLDQPAPLGATWELRFGPKNRFRVFYEVEADAQTVRILAIGVKEGNRLFIGREEIES